MAKEEVRKKIEQELQKRFPDEISSPLFGICDKGILHYANSAGELFLKEISCEVAGKAPPLWHEAITTSIEKNRVTSLELKNNGSSYIITFQPVKDKSCVFAETVDITSKKKTERELLKSRERFEKAQQIAHIGSWEWDVKTDTIEWSDEVYRIFGAKPQKFVPTYEKFLAFVHDEDRQIVIDAIKKSLETKEEYAIRHRIVRADRSERVVRDRGKIYTDEVTGEPIKMIGTLQDISRQKKSDDNFRFAMKILDNTHEGVMTTDSNSRIIYVNPAFTTITGYSQEEAIGESPRLLRSDKHDATFYKEMWKIITKTGEWKGEIWNRRKNGEAYPQHLTIMTEKDDYGRVERHIAVFHDLTQKKQIEEKMKYRENYDPLTGLPNRTFFTDRLWYSIATASRDDAQLTLMIIGIDGFNKINSSLGHSAGDKLLSMIGERVESTFPKDATLARFGGDEYALILQGSNNPGLAVSSASHLVKEMAKPFAINDEELFITASIGVALFPSDGGNAETLIESGDTAMHLAKNSGGNIYRLFSKEMNENAVKRLQIERELRNGVMHEEFVAFYQPKVDLNKNEMVGMESLIRWSHPKRGLVSPDNFVPVAEDTGLIVPMGEQMLRESCRQNVAWQKAGYPPLRVAVNLSARQFTDSDIITVVRTTLEETGMSSEWLELEITESMVMEDVESAISTMKVLADMGIKLSVDDFGTGYSSFGYLKRFPIDSLKIDIIFVKELETNGDDQELVAAMISMAHKLNLKVVAEGVETKGQLKLLREFGADQIQGYYYSKPLNHLEFELLLKEGRQCLI